MAELDLAMCSFSLMSKECPVSPMLSFSHCSHFAYRFTYRYRYSMGHSVCLSETFANFLTVKGECLSTGKLTQNCKAI